MDANTIEARLLAASDVLRDLIGVQVAYDEVGWRVSEPAAAKLRHICLHLMDVTAKFARIAEHNDHLEDEGRPISNRDLAARLSEQRLLLAELLFSVLQLADLGDVDLAAALHDLYVRNAQHFAPESGFASLDGWMSFEALQR